MSLKTARMLAYALALVVAFGLIPTATAGAVGQGPRERAESFEDDPRWEGVGNRSRPRTCPTTRQDFGLRAGRIAGRVQRSLTPAYYAKRIRERSLDDPLSASGTLTVSRSAAASGALFGYFNSESEGWRAPNSLAFRLDGQDGAVYMGVEYGTRTYKTGGRLFEREGKLLRLPVGRRLQWRLVYDPTEAGGRGRVSLVVEGVGHLDVDLGEGHRSEGARFDRFGLFNQQTVGESMEVSIEDLGIGSRAERLSTEGAGDWEGRGNEQSFPDCEREDAHDFGYDVERRAAGGLVWRTEPSRPKVAATYGDRIAPLTLAEPIHARGRVVLERASSDSDLLIGFWGAGGHGSPLPANFLGLQLGGPSSKGFFLSPVFRDASGEAIRQSAPSLLLLPSRETHVFALDYEPDEEGGGTLRATLDGRSEVVSLDRAAVSRGALLNRFGLRNMEAGGHAQEVYLDDLVYTARHGRVAER